MFQSHKSVLCVAFVKRRYPVNHGSGYQVRQLRSHERLSGSEIDRTPVWALSCRILRGRALIVLTFKKRISCLASAAALVGLSTKGCKLTSKKRALPRFRSLFPVPVSSPNRDQKHIATSRMGSCHAGARCPTAEAPDVSREPY